MYYLVLLIVMACLTTFYIRQKKRPSSEERIKTLIKQSRGESLVKYECLRRG